MHDEGVQGKGRAQNPIEFVFDSFRVIALAML